MSTSASIQQEWKGGSHGNADNYEKERLKVKVKEQEIKTLKQSPNMEELIMGREKLSGILEQLDLLAR